MLYSVTTVDMITKSFDFGVRSDIKSLSRTSDSFGLLPGSSLIALRFHQTGELMAARSWRDEKDNWRASTRWIRTQAEDDNRIIVGIRDTELLLTPRVMSADDDRNEGSYNLLAVPITPYSWNPRVLSQNDSSHVREKRRS